MEVSGKAGKTYPGYLHVCDVGSIGHSGAQGVDVAL